MPDDFNTWLESTKQISTPTDKTPKKKTMPTTYKGQYIPPEQVDFSKLNISPADMTIVPPEQNVVRVYPQQKTSISKKPITPEEEKAVRQQIDEELQKQPPAELEQMIEPGRERMREAKIEPDLQKKLLGMATAIGEYATVPFTALDTSIRKIPYIGDVSADAISLIPKGVSELLKVQSNADKHLKDWLGVKRPDPETEKLIDDFTQVVGQFAITPLIFKGMGLGVKTGLSKLPFRKKVQILSDITADLKERAPEIINTEAGLNEPTPDVGNVINIKPDRTIIETVPKAKQRITPETYLNEENNFKTFLFEKGKSLSEAVKRKVWQGINGLKEVDLTPEVKRIQYESKIKPAEQSNLTEAINDYNTALEINRQIREFRKVLDEPARIPAKTIETEVPGRVKVSPKVEEATLPETEKPINLEGVDKRFVEELPVNKKGETVIPKVINEVDLHRQAVDELVKSGEQDITREKINDKIKELEDGYKLQERIEEQLGEPKTTVYAPSKSNKVANWFKDKFTTRGLFPEEIFNANWLKEGNINAKVEEAKFLTSDLKKAVKKEYGKDFQQSDIETMNSVLHGELPNSVLRPRTGEIIQKMRDNIDALTRELVENGIVRDGFITDNITGEKMPISQYYLDNQGKYVNRSYKVFDDSKLWAKNVPEQVMNRARNYFRENYPEMDVDMIEATIQRILNQEESSSVKTHGKMGYKDTWIFKHRKDIAPEIRDLMGEYRDPITNYAKTVTKMSSLLENNRFLQEISESPYFSDKPSIEKGMLTEILPNNEHLAPLAGKFTYKELADAFNEFYKPVDSGKMLQYYTRYFNIPVKVGKTALSPSATLRNFMSNPLIAVANGNLPMTALFKGWKGLLTEFNIATKNVALDRAKFLEYTQQGVVKQSPYMRELFEIMKDAKLFENDISGFMDKWGTKIKRGAKTPGKIYGAMDDFWKIVGYEMEKAKYKKVYPEWTEGQVRNIAGQITRDNYPTYGVLPKYAKFLRRQPFFGTFTSFPISMMIVTKNIFKRAGIEFMNPRTRTIGAKRFTGLLTALVTSQIAVEGVMSLLGINKDEDVAIRAFMPEWAKNSSVMYLDKGAGKYRYFDLSYTDPFNYIKKPFIAGYKEFQDSGRVDKVFIQGLKEFFDPYISPEILAGKLGEVFYNKKSNGQPVYNPQEPTWDQAMEIAGHIWEGFEPGGITSAKRIYSAFTGKTSLGGTQFEKLNEIISTGGIRVSTVDVKQSLKFKALGFNKDLQDASTIYNRVYYREGEKSTDEVENAYDIANASREKLITDFRNIINKAKLLGITDLEIDEILSQNNITRKVREDLFNGTFTPIEKEKKIKKYKPISTQTDDKSYFYLPN